MALVPYVVAYVGLAVFVVAVIARFIMWSKLPMHLRWELYPVAHEAKKAAYGGSYLEESKWWTKPREKSMMGELKVMVPEIMFLEALKENNPKMWARSFPFHFGIYLVIASTVLMMVNGVGTALLPSLSEGSLGSMVRYGVLMFGVVGLALGVIGAVGLIHRRRVVPELKYFSVPADFFNLGFFVVAFGWAFLSYLFIPGYFTKLSAFISNMVTFEPLTATAGLGSEPILLAVSVVLMSLLVAYIPLTHMSHFVGKYFAYHAIRWADEPNPPGGDQEAEIMKMLQQKVTWAAPHIQGGGTKTWVDLATQLPAEWKEEKKK